MTPSIILMDCLTGQVFAAGDCAGEIIRVIGYHVLDISSADIDDYPGHDGLP